MEENFNFGVVEDPRTNLEKEQDWLHPAGAVALNWIEKDPSIWKKYTKRYQDGSLSCVSQSCAKAEEVLTKGIVTSAHPIYRKRYNFPSGGMWLQDCGNIAKNSGTTTEDLDVSENIGEQEMNRDIAVPTPQKVLGYVMVNPKDIDAIAEGIELYGECLMTFSGNYTEWLEEPVYSPALPQNISHCVCGVDYFLENGKKIILIEDSARPETTINQQGQRKITEDYLKGRFFDAMYLIGGAFKFTQTLRYGNSGPDVFMLQKVLKNQGLYTSTVDGMFGKITLASVKAFQSAHSLSVDGIVGPHTNEVLNTLL